MLRGIASTLLSCAGEQDRSDAALTAAEWLVRHQRPDRSGRPADARPAQRLWEQGAASLIARIGVFDAPGVRR